MSSILIVGAGFVGTGMRKIFPDADVHDPAKGLQRAPAHRYQLAIICVPTPMQPDGGCNTAIVRAACQELSDARAAEIILIKSTVEPGTTQKLDAMLGPDIVFSPEYMGESRYWTPAAFPQPHDPLSHGFMILGGEPWVCSQVADLFLPRLGPATRIRFMSALEAELVKYAENSFFALKVTFANELRRIAEAAGANYHTVREGWLDDPRVGPMHTAAFKDAPGFSGKCLPKDINALAHYARSIGVESDLLQAVIRTNDELQQPETPLRVVK